MLPDFVIIGAGKTGTTALARYLSAHPDIFIAPQKEVNYFSFRYFEGPSWYAANFEGATPGQRVGEASPQYTRHPSIPNCAPRMAETIPDAQLIYVLRHPIHRIRSHYQMLVERGREERPFDRAVRENPVYMEASSYAHQLGLYLEHYERDAILLVASERLRIDRAAEFGRVLEFLGVDPSHQPDDLVHEHNTSEHRTAPPSWYRVLRSIVRRTPVPRMLSSARKSKVNRHFGRAYRPGELDLTPETEAWIWSELADDLRQLRSIAGPDFDLWGRA